MKATIVIIHFSNLQYTTNCIRTIFQSKPKDLFEINVVFNGSDINELYILKRNFHTKPNVKIYLNKSENKGFSAGIEFGMIKARYNYIVILDNDTTVKPHWLDNLLQPFEDPETGMTTSLILDPYRKDNTIIGGRVNILGFSYPNIIARRNNATLNNKSLFYGVTSWCVRKDLLKQIGVDKKYLFFSDDADIGFKIRALGFNVIPAFGSEVLHYKTNKDNAMAQNVANKKVIILNRDYLIFSYLNLNKLHFLLFFVIFLLLKIALIPYRLFKNDRSIQFDIQGIKAFFHKDNELVRRKHEHLLVRKVHYADLVNDFSRDLYVSSAIFR